MLEKVEIIKSVIENEILINDAMKFTEIDSY